MIGSDLRSYHVIFLVGYPCWVILSRKLHSWWCPTIWSSENHVGTRGAFYFFSFPKTYPFTKCQKLGKINCWANLAMWAVANEWGRVCNKVTGKWGGRKENEVEGGGTERELLGLVDTYYSPFLPWDNLVLITKLSSSVAPLFPYILSNQHISLVWLIIY